MKNGAKIENNFRLANVIAKLIYPNTMRQNRVLPGIGSENLIGPV